MLYSEKNKKIIIIVICWLCPKSSMQIEQDKGKKEKEQQA